jgi:hypothetical protein
MENINLPSEKSEQIILKGTKKVEMDKSIIDIVNEY